MAIGHPRVERKVMRQSSWIVLAALVLASVQALALASELRIRDARVQLLPGDRPAAGYFRLENRGSRAVVLIGAESPAFGDVMMHQSTRSGGSAHMEHVE